VQLKCRPRTRDHLKIRAVTELRDGCWTFYLEAMRGNSHTTSAAAVLLVGLTMSLGLPTFAQDARDSQGAPDDAAGRRYFESGRAAFEEADYERALVDFRRAYRLSLRGELQYNIGVAAARLQREEEALAAFERYLQETEEPAREAEVRERIDALRESIAEREATKLALEEASVVYRSPAVDPIAEPADGKRLPISAIAGGTTLAALGAAGVAAMSVGFAKNGSCTQEVAGACVTEHSATAWSWVYGGLGIAALAGSATWFAISARRTREGRETRLSVSPTGLKVSGRF
jgi:tetratricopeptide (TPR) repeat protein